MALCSCCECELPWLWLQELAAIVGIVAPGLHVYMNLHLYMYL